MSTSTDLERSWARDERWAGITRPYRADDVERLRGTLPIQYTLASHGATRLWQLLRDEPCVAVLSAVTGNQAVQEVRAGLLTTDIDEYDRRWCTGERSPEGFFVIHDGVEAAIARARAYAPYADMLWFETAKPDLDEAKQFAEAIHKEYPGKQIGRAHV